MRLSVRRSGQIQVVLALAAFLFGTNTPAEPLHLVTAAFPPIAPEGEHSGFMENVAREAFRRAGVEITVAVLPGERALINANAGLDDGDLLRIPGIRKDYPNLIRVPEQAMEFEFVGYTLQENNEIKQLADLKPYSVAYVTGWKYYEKNVTAAREVTTVRGLRELFLLLKKHRADVVLADRWQGLWMAQQVGVKVHPLPTPFARSEMYMYLHKRHAALVPKVAGALADMKQDGTYQNIVAKYLHPLALQ